MKGYYIYSILDKKALTGVTRKINMQTAQFQKVLPFTQININTGAFSGLQKVLRLFPTAKYSDYEKALPDLDDPGVLYFRRSHIDKGLVVFLKKLKAEHPGCLVIMEMPVFPYFKDAYCHNLRHFIRNSPLWIKDCIYRKKLKGLVDYIATFSDDKEILGIPALHIFNGIDVDSVVPRTPREPDGALHITSVAVMAVHHGFERLIQGIADYYAGGGKRDILYRVVGFGNEEPRYRALVSELGLEDRVIFCGKKTGAELDEIYNETDIAVTSLGMYKIGIKVGSFIKTGEYLAKGIPMLTGCTVDVLDHSDFDYFIEFPSDETPIDIQKVLEFYDEISSRGSEKMINEIRAYAYKKVDGSVAMKSVTDVMREWVDAHGDRA